MKPEAMTVGALAKACGLSRSTLLYYSRLGLLKPHGRSPAGYRLYTTVERERLEQICVYRQMGIALSGIARVLAGSGTHASAEILHHRLEVLSREIAELQRQQRQIVEILKQQPLQEGVTMISKDRWVEIMRAAGLNDEDMHNWHQQFEKMEPEAHQEFLESLGIKATEVNQIRQWSRG